jgi:hypothetical protein
MECCGAGKTRCLTESGGEMEQAGSWNVVKWKMMIRGM